jgi:hypothetical protein
MPAPVSLVTVHHEGAGAPTTAANAWRCSEGGYTYAIGTDTFARFRDVWSSYATLDRNGVSVDLVLPGNRMEHAVTDHDLDVIAAALDDARAHGYVVDEPEVVAHRNSPGSSTVCPGDFTMARWHEVVAACLGESGGASAPPVGGDDVPGDKETVARLVTDEGAWDLQYDGGVRTVRGPFYGSYFSLPANVRNDPARRFRVLCAPSDGGAHGYDLVSIKGEAYAMRTRQ